MAISYIGAATGVNSATLPTHQSGDLIVVLCIRDGSNTAPALPSGWTNVYAFGASNISFRVGYKIATSNSETTGTWTNATGLVARIYRGASSVGSNGMTTIISSNSSISYPSITLSSGEWGLALAGHRSINTALETVPSGYSNYAGRVDSVCEIATFDSTASTSSQDIEIGGTTSSNIIFITKISAELTDTTAPTLSNQQVTNVGDGTTGTPKVTTNESNGTIYMVCVPDGDSPSVEQIKAGQRSNGTAAIAAQNQGVVGLGQQTFSNVTGLTENTPYDFWFVHTDAASNNSTAVKADFTPTVPQISSTTWLNPTQSIQQGSNVSWTNLSNVYAEDNARATVTLGANELSNEFFFYGFDFSSIPTNVKINGIQVRFKARVTSGSLLYNYLFLTTYPLFHPASVNTYQLTGITSSDAYVSVGGATDLWGGVDTNNDSVKDRDWQRSDFDSDLQVFGQFAADTNGATLEIDNVQIKVFYTPTANSALWWAFP